MEIKPEEIKSNANILKEIFEFVETINNFKPNPNENSFICFDKYIPIVENKEVPNPWHFSSELSLFFWKLSNQFRSLKSKISKEDFDYLIKFVKTLITCDKLYFQEFTEKNLEEDIFESIKKLIKQPHNG